MESRASITFYGGAGEVTGANFLFDVHSTSSGQVGKRILIDCGALQRENGSEDENLKPFAYDPASIDVLFITHAHQDHIGRVPKLVHDGFKGVIYSTAATKDLAALMFEDAVHVMQDAQMRHHSPMMYQQEDADRALSLWQTREYHESFSIGDVKIEFLDAGHILGSAMVKFSRNGRTIIFTGDLGNSPEPLLNDTEEAGGANYILMESVYGDRVHEGIEGRREMLRTAIEDARARGGTLLIPSFSIERTQILLAEMDSMMEEGVLAPIPVYLDAPLAIRVTEVFRKYANLLNSSVRERFARGDDPFSFKSLHVIHSTGESHEVDKASDPKVIIAGAGMSSGGRIRAHEKDYLPDPKASVLFVGYQAPGSLGRRIEDGEKNVEIDRERVTVRAHISNLTGYSGHKDRDGLLAFVETAGQSLEKVFVAMGEPAAEMYLAQRIRDFLGIDAIAPQAGEKIEINF